MSRFRNMIAAGTLVIIGGVVAAAEEAEPIEILVDGRKTTFSRTYDFSSVIRQERLAGFVSADLPKKLKDKGYSLRPGAAFMRRLPKDPLKKSKIDPAKKTADVFGSATEIRIAYQGKTHRPTVGNLGFFFKTSDSVSKRIPIEVLFSDNAKPVQDFDSLKKLCDQLMRLHQAYEAKGLKAFTRFRRYCLLDSVQAIKPCNVVQLHERPGVWLVDLTMCDTVQLSETANRLVIGRLRYMVDDVGHAALLNKEIIVDGPLDPRSQGSTQIEASYRLNGEDEKLFKIWNEYREAALRACQKYQPTCDVKDFDLPTKTTQPQSGSEGTEFENETSPDDVAP